MKNSSDGFADIIDVRFEINDFVSYQSLALSSTDLRLAPVIGVSTLPSA
jgi:hypothetical protein